MRILCLKLLKQQQQLQLRLHQVKAWRRDIHHSSSSFSSVLSRHNYSNNNNSINNNNHWMFDKKSLYNNSIHNSLQCSSKQWISSTTFTCKNQDTTTTETPVTKIINENGETIVENTESASSSSSTTDTIPKSMSQEDTPSSTDSLFTQEVIIKMPDMGEGDDNTIEIWYKKPGDLIQHNDVLCDISTPDFTFGMVIEDEEDAIMGEILVSEGEGAKDNQPICITYHKKS